MAKICQKLLQLVSFNRKPLNCSRSHKIRISFVIFFFPVETDAFCANNELIQPHDKQPKSMQSVSSGNIYFKRIKYITFSAIWAFVAWNLLTIKEKIPTKFNVLVDANETKSKLIHTLVIQH